jgi:hypothetical protein
MSLWNHSRRRPLKLPVAPEAVPDIGLRSSNRRAAMALIPGRKT